MLAGINAALAVARRRALRPRPLGGVRRGAGRRSDEEGPRRTVPALHVARRVPAPARGRHRASAALPHGRRLGLISEEEFASAMRSEDRLRVAETALRTTTFTPSVATLGDLQGALGVEIASPTTAFKLLQRNDLSVDRLASVVPAHPRRARPRGAERAREPRPLRGLRSARARAARTSQALRIPGDPGGLPVRGTAGPLAPKRSSNARAAGRGPSERPRASPA